MTAGRTCFSLIADISRLTCLYCVGELHPGQTGILLKLTESSSPPPEASEVEPVFHWLSLCCIVVGCQRSSIYKFCHNIIKIGPIKFTI